MLKKLISAILIIICITTLFCSCGEKEGTTFLIPVESDPMCLDPQTADNSVAEMIVSNCYEGLVRIDENYKIVPGVAESWNISADKKTYTFHLRKDTKWQILNSHDGILGDEEYINKFDSTVKAEDFVFGLQRAVLPETQATNVDKIFCIKNARAINEGTADASQLGVKATDDFTLVITLERANDDFLRVLTLPICMPCNEEFFDKTEAKYGMEVKYTFCNGPFYISKWTDDNSVSILKNEGYKGNNEVKASGVYFYVNNDEATVVKKIKQKSYDCASLSESMYTQLEDDEKIAKLACNNSVVGLCFNCSEPTVSDVNIRKALLSAVDKDNLGITANGIVPDCVRYGEKSFRDAVGGVSYPAYDKNNSLNLFEKGLDNLGIDSAEITILCTEEYSENMKKMIQSWQQIFGTKIVAKVTVKTEEEIESAVNAKSYQIVLRNIKSETSYVTDVLEQFVSTSKNNVFAFNDESYDNLYNSIINTADGDEILTQCKKAENELVQNGVFYPLYKDYDYIAVRNDVSGLIIEPAYKKIYFLMGEVA